MTNSMPREQRPIPVTGPWITQKEVEAVADATALPLLIYNIPYRTGVTLELATLQALVRNPQFAAIKECGADANRLSALIEETPLAVLSGEVSLMFDPYESALPAIRNRLRRAMQLDFA